MKTLSPSRRRFIELCRRVNLLWSAWSESYGELTPPGGYPAALTGALDAVLRRKRVPANRLYNFRYAANRAAAWALTLEPNVEVCAEFAVELAFARRAMTSMADVSFCVERVGYGEVYGQPGAVVWGAWRGNGNVTIPCFTALDKDALRAMVPTTVNMVTAREAIVGRWLPSTVGAHLYGTDTLCPPAEALAIVAGWLSRQDPAATRLGAMLARSTRPQVVTLGLGPFVGPMALGTMIPGVDILVDGFPFEGRRVATSTRPVGIVVNFASDTTLRVAVEPVEQSGDIKAFKRDLDAAMTQVDGWGDCCQLLVQRLSEYREGGVPVFVMGGPATHGVFTQFAHELGLVPEVLFGHDTSRCGIFVQNAERRAKRGIPHLPGTVVWLWRWS